MPESNNSFIVPCTRKEYDCFVLFYEHINNYHKLLCNESGNYSKITYKKIELEEYVTESWQTITKVGISVGIDISNKLTILKDIIANKEVENPYLAVDPPFTIDGEYYDEIQALESARKHDEEARHPRYALLDDFRRIMVRINKRFNTDTEIKLQSSATTTQQVESPVPYSTSQNCCITPAAEKAYQSYNYAISQAPELVGKIDKEVHSWLSENGLAEYKLPSFNTWQRQVRIGRKHYGTQKNTPRSNRTSPSVKPYGSLELSDITNQYKKEKAD